VWACVLGFLSPLWLAQITPLEPQQQNLEPKTPVGHRCFFGGSQTLLLMRIYHLQSRVKLRDLSKFHAGKILRSYFLFLPDLTVGPIYGIYLFKISYEIIYKCFFLCFIIQVMFII
jgi:hypothetical protein